MSDYVVGLKVGEEWTRERDGPVRISGRLHCVDVAVTGTGTGFRVTGKRAGTCTLRMTVDGTDPEWGGAQLVTVIVDDP